MKFLFSIYWVLFGGLWYFVNGILHTFFVLKEHKGTYNRDLLRLLRDGHVLVFSGFFLFACFWMLQKEIQPAAVIGCLIALSMIVYCLLIFPFLKSYATLGISFMVLFVCVKILAQFR
jgi:hypothetical protein